MMHKQPLQERFRKVLLLFFAFALFPACVYAQIKVSGTVVDENDEPLIGVSVIEDGTQNGAATDIDGNFYLTVKNGSSRLKFSYIGYEPYEIKVGKKISFDIHMTPKLGELEEVVVVGYGKQVKASVVGSIASVEPERLRVGTTANVQDNLAGQLAGIIAYKPSGEPGWDQSEFWIRGISSFKGTTSPLVLIDGVERSLSDVDASEIESFSILKDASASAVYGVRGANGVILVNTKRGKIGAPQVSFRFEQAFRSPGKSPEFIGAADYMQLTNDLAAEQGVQPFTQQQIDLTRSGYDPELYPDVVWIDAIQKDNSDSSRANLTVSGGSDFLRYSLTASWFRESGIINTDERLPYDTGTKNNKYNLRANVDMNVTKTTQLRFNVGGMYNRVRKQDYATDALFGYAFETAPNVHPAIYSDGTIPQVIERVNPWALATQTGYTTHNWTKVQAMASVEQDLKMLLPGLKVRAMFSFDTYSSNRKSRGRTPTYYQPSTARDELGNLIHGEPINTDGSDYLSYWEGNDSHGDYRTYIEAAANYDNVFDKVHRVGAMFLYNQTSYDTGGAVQPYRHQGIAGRFSYTFDSRYVAEFNFGYNGSENFAPGHRYGFFPSGAIGWIASNEKFWEPVANVISKLKFRGSIGQVGNDQLGSGARRFAYITTMNSGASSYNFGTTANYYAGAGITEGEIGVDNLKWETVTKYNFGVELGLWNALDVQFDIFKENRKDIFMQRAVIPTQTGFASSPWANYGKVENHGVEASIEFNKSLTKDLAVGLRANFTYAKNKVTECDEPESVKGTHRSQTGQSINTLWGYLADGLYTAEDFDADGNLVEGLPIPELRAQGVRPGDIKYVDRNGDGVINTKDEGYIGGTTTPRIVYGFGGNVMFKGFDFSFFFQGTGDSYRMLDTSSYLIPGSGQGTIGNVYTNYTDAWTEENPSQDVFWPRLTYGKNTHNQQNSTWFKKDISYLRLKTVELGYTLPRKWTSTFGCNQARLYVSGNDLLCFSGFKLWDPELSTRTGMQYPFMKSVMFGFELKF